MPAFAQVSSLSPPGDPETPTPPMTSFPALIGTPPPTATTPKICFRNAFSGLSVKVLNSEVLCPRVRAVYALRRANSIVSGLLPSPRIDAATLPARSTTTTETLFPSFVHCSLAPSRIISAIRIEMFFSTCGVCALANTAASIASAEAIDTRNRRGANDMVTLPDLLWPGLRTTWALEHLTPRRRKECSRPLRQ